MINSSPFPSNFSYIVCMVCLYYYYCVFYIIYYCDSFQWFAWY